MPIWKFVLLFYVYIKNYLGEREILDEPHKLNLHQMQKHLVGEKWANLKQFDKIEEFYKRLILWSSLDNPIPQIIVVGIFWLLLTTCPTANRIPGGIDIHEEWV